MKIPNKVIAGFTLPRHDCDKLAYITYINKNGRVAKEASWNSWRETTLNPDEFDNEPTNGFVLNKDVGGIRHSMSQRNSYVRMHHPRGFEFEITLPNLLYILEHSDTTVKKGIEGEFVIGWDKDTLWLIPTNSQLYEEADRPSYNGSNRFYQHYFRFGKK